MHLHLRALEAELGRYRTAWLRPLRNNLARMTPHS